MCERVSATPTANIELFEDDNTVLTITATPNLNYNFDLLQVNSLDFTSGGNDTVIGSTAFWSCEHNAF